MPRLKATAPSGMEVVFDWNGDAPPTDAELQQIFAEARKGKKDSGSQFIDNAKRSGQNFVGGLASMAMNPIDTATSMIDLGYGAVGGALGLPMYPEADNANRALGNYVKERASHPLETLYEDPVGALADISTIATGAGGALRLGGRGAQIARLGRTSRILAETGRRAGQVARLTDPLSVVTELPAVAGGKLIDRQLAKPEVARKVEAGWRKAFTSSFKPTVSARRLNKGKDLIKGIGEHGILPNEASVRKLEQGVARDAQKVTDAAEAAAARGVRFKLKDAEPGFEAARDALSGGKIGKAKDVRQGEQAIQEWKDNYSGLRPMTDEEWQTALASQSKPVASKPPEAPAAVPEGNPRGVGDTTMGFTEVSDQAYQKPSNLPDNSVRVKPRDFRAGEAAPPAEKPWTPAEITVRQSGGPAAAADFDRAGAGVPTYPLNVVPNAVLPRVSQNVMDALVPDRFKAPVVETPREPVRWVSEGSREHLYPNVVEAEAAGAKRPIFDEGEPVNKTMEDVKADWERGRRNAQHSLQAGKGGYDIASQVVNGRVAEAAADMVGPEVGDLQKQVGMQMALRDQVMPNVVSRAQNRDFVGLGPKIILSNLLSSMAHPGSSVGLGAMKAGTMLLGAAADNPTVKANLGHWLFRLQRDGGEQALRSLVPNLPGTGYRVPDAFWNTFSPTRGTTAKAKLFGIDNPDPEQTDRDIMLRLMQGAFGGER